jgi:hypothetical protein
MRLILKSYSQRRGANSHPRSNDFWLHLDCLPFGGGEGGICQHEIPWVSHQVSGFFPYFMPVILRQISKSSPAAGGPVFFNNSSEVFGQILPVIDTSSFPNHGSGPLILRLVDVTSVFPGSRFTTLRRVIACVKIRETHIFPFPFSSPV